MFLEPILTFLLIGYLRRVLRRTSIFPGWSERLKFAMFAVVAIFIVQVVFSLGAITTWIWRSIVLVLIYITFKRREFSSARNMIFAFLPLFIVSVLSDIIKLFPARIHDNIDRYLGVAYPFSIVWMVVMLIIFNKQRKTLEKEHKKLQEEANQKQVIATRKAELEILVAERTSEIMEQKNELEQTLAELRNAQAQLIQSEKMASLGELTAGIAHEIQNPLNFVNNFSEVNRELIEELKSQKTKLKIEEQEEILKDIDSNLEKISHHGKRADAIVKGMLQHSRASSGQKEMTDINALCHEYLRLAYHGLRAKDKSFNAKYETDFDPSLPKMNVVPQDIGRVLLNLINNAFYATSAKASALADNSYMPTVTVSTKKLANKIEIKIRDNGTGIPQKVLDKIFQPFFTTKPTGQGTGLGLSLSYDIVKAHGGEIKAETKEGEGSKFIIQLPDS